MQHNERFNFNLSTLLATAINDNYDDIIIGKRDLMDDTFMLSFRCEITLDELKRVNEYFKTDIRCKTMDYSLIVNKNTNIMKLTLDNILNNCNSSFIELTSSLLDKYNTDISNKLNQLRELLYNVIYSTDTKIDNWTFYYISHNGSHIGFANKNTENSSSFKLYEMPENLDFYKNVLQFNGTYTDACIKCLRRNCNSKFNGGWKVCKYGTPIHELV